jgi:hypothetical protein
VAIVTALSVGVCTTMTGDGLAGQGRGLLARTMQRRLEIEEPLDGSQQPPPPLNDVRPLLMRRRSNRFRRAAISRLER